MDIKEKIRVIKDFPEKGISFKDITTLLKDADAFRFSVESIAKKFEGKGIDLVVGPEARGFVIGAPVAYILKAGFVPVRKPGKLPADTVSYTYDLEYGKDRLEMHCDAIKKGDKVLVVDDLLATGGTTKATINLIEKLGGNVIGIAFLTELTELNGRDLLAGYHVFSLTQY